MIVTTFQAVSGAGVQGIEDLKIKLKMKTFHQKPSLIKSHSILFLKLVILMI